MKKLLSFLILTAPSLALAHPGHGSDLGLLDGITHPLTGLDHLLAMLAVGLWAASFNGKARWGIPAAFIGMMTLGFIFGTNGGSIPLLEQGIAASVLIIGLAAAWAQRLPAVAAATVVGAFALFHGIAHGAEMHGHAVWFALGFIISTAVLHAAGFAIGTLLNQKIWLNRIIGTIIGAIGLSLLLA